jgi:hypothetical protein
LGGFAGYGAPSRYGYKVKDFLDELVEEWTKVNPEFPKLLEEAEKRCKEQEDKDALES